MMTKEKLIDILKEAAGKLSELYGSLLYKIILCGFNTEKHDSGEYTELSIVVIIDAPAEKTKTLFDGICRIFSRSDLDHDTVTLFRLIDKESYYEQLPCVLLYRQAEKEGILIYSKD